MSQAKPKIRLILVDDHPVVRQALKGMIEKEKDFVILAEAGSAEEAKLEIRRIIPDILLLDISLPKTNGISLARELRVSHPELKILFLSMHAEPKYATQALLLGAGGYVLKTSEAEDIVTAIRTVAAGKRYVSPELGAALVEAQSISQDETVGAPLSDREKEVIQLLSQGLSAKDVADQLKISHRTVEAHKMNSMRKLKVKNSVELVKIAIESGWIQN